MKSTITKLPHPEQCGDWHDKPLRWAVRTGTELQKFSTKKEALLYKRLRRLHGSESAAGAAYIATA
jgi:hypothetical protein